MVTPQSIRVRFSDDGLFGNFKPENVDDSATARSFTENLENALYDEYPKAELEIIHGINDDHSADGHTDTIDAENVGLAVNKVWESFDWIQYQD